MDCIDTIIHHVTFRIDSEVLTSVISIILLWDSARASDGTSYPQVPVTDFQIPSEGVWRSIDNPAALKMEEVVYLRATFPDSSKPLLYIPPIFAAITVEQSGKVSMKKAIFQNLDLPLAFDRHEND